MQRRTFLGGTAAAIVLSTAATGSAAPTTIPIDQPSKKLEWTHTRVRVTELAATGVFLGGAVAASFLRPRDNSPSWRGGVLFDDAASGFARAGDDHRRSQIANVSDMFLYGMIAFPYLDAAYAAGVRHSPDAAMQMALINTQAFALTGLTTQLIKMTVKRERPWAARCNAEAPNDPSCSGSDSFLSGHSSMTFTSAGLTCAHHEALSLYGSPVADGAACVAALGMASATAFMRVAADKHYASDVFAGAALGLASGYLLPKLLHYGSGSSSSSGDHVSKKPKKSVAWSAAPVPTRNGAMLSVSGVFF